MEFIILAAALLIMTPLFLLPFVSAAHETMEADLRNRAKVTPLRTTRPATATVEQPQAA